MEIRVRKATSNDFEELCELFDEIDIFHRVNLPHIFQKPDGPAREQGYFLGLIEDENVGFFVGEVSEKLVGFVHVLITDTPVFPIVIPQHYAVVDSIVVRSEFQKRGYGRMLMKKAQEWAATKGAAFIELGVYQFNQTAISFYEELGYQTSRQRMRKDLKNGKAG
jgi:ribosomal protein S18 acetylase RimI-like enzyme